MGIFSRLNTVIKSNLNSLVDKAEDPEKLIGQTVIDMKAEVKRAKRELVSTLGASKRLAKEADEIALEVTSWEKKAVLALKSGDDDLAREALKRKAKSQQRLERVRGQSAQQASSADAMKDTLEKVEQKIDDLEARKSTLAGQVRRARDTPSVEAGGGSRFGSETFDELERMAGKIDQLDAEVEVHSLVDDAGDRADLEARFAALGKTSADGAVEDELAALKAKLDD